MTFFERVTTLQQQNATQLCLGLDLRLSDIANYDNSINVQGLHDFALNDTNGLLHDAYSAFARHLIDVCHPYICAVKPNLAFYQQYALETALADIIATAHEYGLPVILDAKYGDIDTSSAAYTHAAYHRFRADSVTLSPYLGPSSTEAFLKNSEKAAFVLAHTSNQDAASVQDFRTRSNKPLFVHIAEQYAHRTQVGFVVGATQPAAIKEIRRFSKQWILAPGVGAQNASHEDAQRAAQENIIFPVSRAIATAKNPQAYIRSLHETMKPKSSPSLVNQQDLHTDSLQRILRSFSEQNIIQFGSFTYKTGIKAPFYMNIRNIIGDPDLLTQVCSTMIACIKHLDFDKICGITYGALGCAFTIAHLLAKPALVLRKEGAKSYGSKDALIGPYSPGDRVLIIEEMTTTGSSIIETAELLRERGLCISDAVVFYTGIGNPKKKLSEKDIVLHAVLDFAGLLTLLESGAYIDDGQKRSLLALQKEQ